VAGETSGRSNLIVSDCVVFAQRLEELGFVYSEGVVLIIEKEWN